jgi:chromosome segregation ATPase
MYTNTDYLTEIHNNLNELREKSIIQKEMNTRLEETINKLEQRFQIVYVLQERNEMLQQRVTYLEGRINELNKIMMKYYAYNKPPKQIEKIEPIQTTTTFKF